jgi:hypothetical protein
MSTPSMIWKRPCVAGLTGFWPVIIFGMHPSWA